MNFQAFQKFIPKAANHYGIGKELDAIKVCREFDKLIPEIFEKLPSPKDHIRPAHYKNKHLVVSVSSPAWAQEVIMRKPKIIEEMNKKAGKKIIYDLYTQLFS